MSMIVEILEKQRETLYRKLRTIGDFRRGMVSENFRKCGKPNCACAQEGHLGHGSQHLWNATINGKSQAKNLHRGSELRKYVGMDGTGIPVVKKETENRRGKGSDGQAKTREVKLGCVFTQTKIDKEGRPVRDEESTSYIGAIEAAEPFGSRLYAEAHRRGLNWQKRLSCSVTALTGSGISRKSTSLAPDRSLTCTMRVSIMATSRSMSGTTAG